MTEVTPEEDQRFLAQVEERIEEIQREAAQERRASDERNRKYMEALLRSPREQAAEEAARAEVEQQRAEQATRVEEEVLAQVNAQMVRVPGGSFVMGCMSEHKDCRPNESPIHRVEVGSFEISKYEVTQEIWEAVMGGNPSHFRGCTQCPVEQVSWDDIQVFLQRLNASGGQYRLPSEAEWEYAAGGGQKSQGYKYAGSDDPAAAAWYRMGSTSSGGKTHPVGQKQSNELGLYDMSGNVWEWVQDCWNDSYAGAPSDGRAWEQGSCSFRVLRGGSWIDTPRGLRSTVRSFSNHWGHLIGFRLARSLP